MTKFSDLARQGIIYTPMELEAPPKEESGDFVRGFKKAMYQMPQTLGGSIALVGDAAGSDGMRQYGMEMYDRNTAKVQELTKDSDSLTNVLNGDASAVDWGQNAAGYVAGQALTAIGTGGAGGFIGSQLAKRGIREVVARGARSAAAKQVAGKVAAHGAKVGAGTAMFGTNLMQEAGSIYPEAVHTAEQEGRTLDGGDLARVGGAAVTAAGVDTAMDALMLGRVLKGGRKPGESMARAALREVPGGAAREAATEGIQTGIERYGAQQQLTTADAIRDYVDSMGVGALGGAGGGGIAVLNKQRQPVSGPLTAAANAALDDQILQLTHDPQPLISFPDGSVGHKQDLEAYLSQFTDPDERLAKHREIMGRDPATGKRPEPEPEPTAESSEDAERYNLQAWASRHRAVNLDYAQALIAAPGAKGKDLMIVPHPKGRGYTVVPSKWLTLHTQATYAALQKGDEGMLPGPDREAPGGAIRVDSEGGAAPETYGDQVRTAQRQRADAAAEAEAKQLELDLGKQTPQGVPALDAVREPGTILNPKDEPFKSEMAAKRRLSGGLAETHDIVPVVGGFVLNPKGGVNDEAVPTQVADGAGGGAADAGLGADPAAGVEAPGQVPAQATPADAEGVGAPDPAAVRADPAADAQPALTTELDAAAHAAATSPLNDLPEPTEAQQNAGNYKKAHVSLHGLDISIENPAGSTRKGVDRSGRAWETPMHHHYGYIRRTEGADGDHVDAFIGPAADSDRVYIVNQIDPTTGQFDEHKVLFGFQSKAAARRGYQSNYEKGWKGGKEIVETDVEGFKAWLKDGDTTKPFAGPAPTAPAEAKHARQDAEVRKAAENIAKRKKDKAAPEAQPAPVEHNGTRIYPARVKVADGVQTMWGVESADNRVRRENGERALGGDSLHSTVDEAKAAADRERKQAAEQAEADRQRAESEAAEADAVEARKAANRGKSVVERRAEAVLDKPTKLPPSAGLGRGSRREAMDKAIEQGRAIVVKQVRDQAAKQRDRDLMDRFSRSGYMIDHSNPNLPEVKAAREARDRLKADQYTKPEYRVYSGSDTDGSFFEISKTEYDYARAKMDAPAAEPATEQQPQPGPVDEAPAPTQRTASAEQGADGRWTVTRKEADGTELPPLVLDNAAQAQRERINWERGTTPTDKPLHSQESDLDAAATTGYAAGKKGITTPPYDQDSEQADAWRIGNRRARDEAPTPAADAVEPDSFDLDAWDKARAERIKTSKEAGNEHLDQVPPYVETMRGRPIYNVHDAKERGVVRTVDNRGNVYVNWSDAYSAEKNLASPSMDGKKQVFQTSLGPNDLKDYVFADKAAKPTPAADSVIPSGNTDSDEQDTGADIPKSFYKKAKVNVDYWVADEQRMETVEVPADRALKDIREDVANLEALLRCMKG